MGGILAGLMADLFLTSTPLGLSALTYCLVGAGVGALRAGVTARAPHRDSACRPSRHAAAVLLFVALGDVLGQSPAA